MFIIVDGRDFVERFLRQIIQDAKPYHASKRMTYEDGLLLIASSKFHTLTHDPYYLNFIKTYLDRYIDEEGTIESYELEDYNIDNILAGNALLFATDYFDDSRYEKAISHLKTQLLTHPRTASGSFWHKLRYPYQIWLDGIYMGQIFYVQCGLRDQDDAVLHDAMRQVENVRRYLFDSERKLYLHAYDERRQMQWADPESGRSPNVWSRSVGWFAMALVEIFECLKPEHQPQKNLLKELLDELLEGMMPHLHPEHKMWFQIVDKPDLPGNYLETSGTAMVAYAMLKASRLGMVDASYADRGREIVSGIENVYLRQEGAHYILGGTCRVAGLDNERRDGSDQYYLSEMVVDNEIKGLAPYFYCYSELMRQQT